jgi:succinoglycan biosynthesis transport protein ExoP
MENQTRSIQDFVQLLLKHKWLIAACVIVVVIPTVIVLIQAEPVYRATATLLIEQEKLRVLDVQEVMSSDLRTKDYFETQLMFLQSPSLARKVIQDLNMAEHPEFMPKEDGGFSLSLIKEALASAIKKMIPSNGDQQGASEAQANDPLYPILKAYQSNLSIEPIKQSRMVNVSYESKEPVLAARVANAHAEAYISKYVSLHLYASQEANRWLQARLDEAQKKLRESEEALQEFQEREGIITTVNPSSGGDKENIVLQKLAELNTALAQAQSERIALETLLHQTKGLSKAPGMIESLPQVIDNELIQVLKQRYVELNRQYLELHKTYGERHPRMVAVQDEIVGIKRRIADEIDKIGKSIEVKYNVAKSREASLRTALEEAKKAAMDLNKKSIRFTMLKQEVDSSRQLYEMLMQRVKETSLTSGLSASNLFIVDRATVPQVPAKPKKKRMLILALFAGLSLGVGLVFFIDYLDNTFHGPDDVKTGLGIPFLGLASLLSFKGRGDQNDTIELVALNKPRCHFAECLRNVRTNILFTLTEPDRKTVVLTSANPAEGKTLIASNLALIMAQMGKSVLLIDADMRQPRMHKTFGVPLEPGLSNLILAQCSITDAIRETDVNHLQILPAGTVPPNPSELLASTGMSWLMQQFKKRFDFVLLDTPPILAATDACLLGGVVDGVVLVVEASVTKRQTVKIALDHLNDVKARILGGILNKLDPKKERYHYSHYSHYYHYYSDEGRKKYRHVRKDTARSSAISGASRR